MRRGARVRLAALGLPLALGGCALHSDMTRLRLQLAEQQRQAVRADSARAAGEAALARLVQSLVDSLNAQQALLGRVRADLRMELLNVEQQLVQVQELTGQSQQRLTELRARIDESAQQISALLPPPGGAPAAAPVPGAGGDSAAVPPGAPGQAAPAPAGVTPVPTAAPQPPEPTADQLMELSIQQLRRGSPSTARSGFAEFLRRFPQHRRAVDAEFFAGEAWSAEGNGDSASAAYQRVVQRYPSSPRAATALYRLATRALQAGKPEEAKSLFTRLTTAYPNSDEAALARDRLRALSPNR